MNTLRRTAEKMLGPDFIFYEPVETYFVNFLREPPEPTGDEPEDFVFEAPKIYEEMPRFYFLKKKKFFNLIISLKIMVRLINSKYTFLQF